MSQEGWTDVNIEWNSVPEFDQSYDSDGENRRERNDFNIEKDVSEFAAQVFQSSSPIFLSHPPKPHQPICMSGYHC